MTLAFARRCGLAALALLAALAPARSETVEGVGPDDARLEVAIERPASQPYEQEMLLLHIRGTYTVTMTLETLEQPAFTDFAWMQLGRDRWSEISVQGRSARRFERTMALFPRRAGELTVPPFLHRLTLLTPDGRRARHDVASDPAEVAVRAAPSGSDWWLPARSLTLTDTTDRDPATLAAGDIVTRTVVLEAAGVSADMLPPMPSLRAPGIAALPAPEQRETRTTPEGPLARVVWSWRLKPLGTDPAQVPAVTFVWFDTASRQARRLILPELAIGRAGAVAGARPGWRGLILGHGDLLVAVAALVGSGLGAVAFGGRRRRPARLPIARLLAACRPDPTRLALRRAARRGDVAGFRAALVRAAGARPDGPEAAALRRLDSDLFGGPAGTVDLPAILRTLKRHPARGRTGL